MRRNLTDTDACEYKKKQGSKEGGRKRSQSYVLHTCERVFPLTHSHASRRGIQLVDTRGQSSCHIHDVNVYIRNKAVCGVLYDFFFFQMYSHF